MCLKETCNKVCTNKNLPDAFFLERSETSGSFIVIVFQLCVKIWHQEGPRKGKRFGLPVFQPKLCMHFSSPSCVRVVASPCYFANAIIFVESVYVNNPFCWSTRFKTGSRKESRIWNSTDRVIDTGLRSWNLVTCTDGSEV
jgi:hypothetical protein